MSSRDRRARLVDDAYLDQLRRSLSCVTTTVLVRRTSGDEPALRRAEMARPPAALRGDRSRVHHFATLLSLPQEADNTDWRINTLGYAYELYDNDGAELLAYHWHPFGRIPVVEPHLHVTNRHPAFDLSKTHLPTGIVSPTNFLRCLIAEFGVEPLRTDWRDVLAKAKWPTARNTR